MDTAEYVRSEVERQHSTQFSEFEAALDHAKSILWIESAEQFGTFVQAIANRVDPNTNDYLVRGNEFTNLRLSHVGFMNGGKATPASEIRHQFHSLMNHWDSVIHNDGEVPDDNELIVDQFVKQLLEIHPWADGNGRTASILRNWLLGTLDNPVPLPYYFGER